MLKLLPGDLVSRDQLAIVLWKQVKFRDAVEQYKQVLAASRKTWRSGSTSRGCSSAILGPKPASAPRHAKSPKHCARRRQNKNIVALQVLAAAYAEAGDFDGDEAILRKALQMPQGQSPGVAAVFSNTIQVYHAHQKD